MEMVFTWISPPPKPAFMSGVADLLTTTLSTRLLGIRLKSKFRLCTSVLGNMMPSNCATLYLSAAPRTTTFLLSVVLTPVILFKVSPMFLSGVALICSAEIPSVTVAAFFCLAYNPSTEAFLYELVTTTVFRLFESSLSTISKDVFWPDNTFTSVICLD
ncbi:hypothetical protein D3C86_1108770 [compost metagenome]